MREEIRWRYSLADKIYILFIILTLIGFICIKGDIAANGIKQATQKGYENIYEAIESSEFLPEEMQDILIAMSPENDQNIQK